MSFIVLLVHCELSEEGLAEVEVVVRALGDREHAVVAYFFGEHGPGEFKVHSFPLSCVHYESQRLVL